MCTTTIIILFLLMIKTIITCGCVPHHERWLNNSDHLVHRLGTEAKKEAVSMRITVMAMGVILMRMVMMSVVTMIIEIVMHI